MKNLRRLILLSFFVFAAGSFLAVKAQDEIPTETNNKPAANARRPNLLAELGLTPEQRQQIQRINQQRRPLQRDAQQRLREAMKNLDQAIYADSISEIEIQNRIKTVQTAQAELVKMRFTSELAIRRILNADQIAKFRLLRQQFEENMINNRDQPRRAILNNNRNLKLRRSQNRQGN